MTIGEKLKELRKRFALSQESLAEKLNVTRQAITKWENDISLPDTNNLVELSRLYGVSVDSLLNIHYGLPNQIFMQKVLN